MTRFPAGPLARLRRWRDFQEARAESEHLRREGERIERERDLARAEEIARVAQLQRAGLTEAPELDLARMHQGVAIEAHAWRSVDRAKQGLEAATATSKAACQAHLRARQASRVAAQRDDRRAAEEMARREKASFDQIADLLAARSTPQ